MRVYLPCILYLLCIIVSLWGFYLFTWWGEKTWRVTGERPSSIFICMWFIFLGVALNNSISLYMRINSLEKITGQTDIFVNSWLWSMRVVPELLGMTAVAGIMTYRVLFKKTLFKANGKN